MRMRMRQLGEWIEINVGVKIATQAENEEIGTIDSTGSRRLLKGRNVHAEAL